MQNPAQTTTEVKPSIDWVKTCINYAQVVWALATVFGVPILAFRFIYKTACLGKTVNDAAWNGSYMGITTGFLLATLLYMFLERKTK